LNRRNNAKQIQIKKRQALVSATRVFTGVNGAPRIVAVIPLGPDISAQTVTVSIAESIDAAASDIPEFGIWKLRCAYMITCGEYQP